MNKEKYCPKPNEREINELLSKKLDTFVYLDSNSTHPVLDSVKEKINEAYNKIGNPSSRHIAGKITRAYVEKSREVIANFLSVKKENIYFFSSGTESNNLIIKGVALKYFFDSTIKDKHFIFSSIEHKSVLNNIYFLEKLGAKISLVKPDSKTGSITIDAIEKVVNNNTCLVSIMSVNNETGVINDIEKISNELKKINKNILIHSDMAQHLGEAPLFDINVLDFATFVPHKFGGPIGVSVSFIKDENKIYPILDGGHQENGIRPGTYNAPLIYGTGMAFSELKTLNDVDIIEKKRYLENELLKRNCVINFYESKRNYSTISVTFNFNVNRFIDYLSENGVFISSGSACNSNENKPSYVLLECGLSEDACRKTARIGLNRFNTIDEINYFINLLDKYKGD